MHVLRDFQMLAESGSVLVKGRAVKMIERDFYLTLCRSYWKSRWGNSLVLFLPRKMQIEISSAYLIKFLSLFKDVRTSNPIRICIVLIRRLAASCSSPENFFHYCQPPVPRRDSQLTNCRAEIPTHFIPINYVIYMNKWTKRFVLNSTWKLDSDVQFSSVCAVFGTQMINVMYITLFIGQYRVIYTYLQKNRIIFKHFNFFVVTLSL